MPRTLSTNAAQAIVAQEYGYDVLIEAPVIGLAYSWFYEPSSGWSHRLLRIESVEIGVPSGGGLGFVSQLVFVVAETGDTQSLLHVEELQRLDGATVTLKLLFAGDAYEDAVALFTGQITAWEVWDGEGQITATDDRLARNLLLPQTVVTLATHANAPEQSIGQALPIVYGSGPILDPIPLLLVDTAQADYQVTGHENANMLSAYGAWPLGTDRLKTVPGTAAQSLVIGTNRLRLLQRLTETQFGANTAVPTVHDAGADVLDQGNLVDDDPLSLATITTTAASGVGDVRLNFTHDDPVGINTIDIDLVNHRKVPTAAVTVHGNFVLDTIRQDGSVAIQGLFASLERRVQSAPQTEHFRIVGVSLEAGHGLRMRVSAVNETGTAGTVTDAYEVGQIQVTASYLVSGPFEAIYLPGQILGTGGGVFDPDDVFEGGVFEEATAEPFQGRTDDFAGTVTGTPFQLLTNPADVIASILVHELGLAVDPTTLSAARTARQTWSFAGGIGAGWFRGRTSALDLLHSLCLQAALYLYPKGDGTVALQAVNPLDSPTFTIGPAGSATDWLLYEPQDPGSPTSTWRRTLRYRGGRNDQVRNSFEIRYAYHSARQQFRRIAQASWLGTNDTGGVMTTGAVELLQLSHAQFGAREPYTLDADFIYDDATAFALLERLIPYWMLPRQEIEFESTMAPLPVLLGETVQVDTVGMPARMRGQVFEIDRVRYDFEQGRIFLHGTARTLLRLDYFGIRDQEHTLWYWWIEGLSQQLVRDTSPPSTGHAQLVDISDPTIPYWLALQDSTAVTRYVLPTPLGQVLVQNTVPLVGTGHTGSPVWMALDGRLYSLTVNEFQQYAVVGAF